MSGYKPEAPIFTKFYGVLGWLLDRVDRFPKSQRPVFGNRIADKAVSILEKIVRALYSKSKVSLLEEANLDLEILRILVRLSKDRQLISLRQYEYVSTEINEVGAMLGGWLKERRSRGNASPAKERR